MDKPAMETTVNSYQPSRRTLTLMRRPVAPTIRHIVLNCPVGCRKEIATLTANFILDGVRFVDLAGADGGQVKEVIDAFLARAGFEPAIATVWYPEEKLESIVAFAHALRDVSPGETQIVHL